jgi:hypothetical protein
MRALAPANGTGVEAQFHFELGTARLKSCPDTKQNPIFPANK